MGGDQPVGTGRRADDASRPSAVEDAWKRLNAAPSKPGFDKLWIALRNELRPRRGAAARGARAAADRPSELPADARRGPQAPCGAPGDAARGAAAAPAAPSPPGGAAALAGCAQRLLDPDVRVRRAALERITVRRRMGPHGTAWGPDALAAAGAWPCRRPRCTARDAALPPARTL
jgi:hypothetical protein